MGNPNLAGNDILAVSLSGDALTMYVAGRIQGARGPIALPTRPSRGNNFAFASPLSAPVNSSPSAEGTPFLAADELSLVFFSERSGGLGESDLFVATRASTVAGFATAVALDSLNSPQGDRARVQLRCYKARSGAACADRTPRAKC